MKAIDPAGAQKEFRISQIPDQLIVKPNLHYFVISVLAIGRAPLYHRSDRVTLIKHPARRIWAIQSFQLLVRDLNFLDETAVSV